jgi:hypothetical protein
MFRPQEAEEPLAVGVNKPAPIRLQYKRFHVMLATIGRAWAKVDGQGGE